MILGAILAGGNAERFGSDKALALLRGRALIEHVAAALAPHVDAMVTCGRPYGDLPVIADLPRGGLGPLGGIAAALDHAARHGFDRVLTVPCDTPLLDPVLLGALRANDAPAIIAACPVIGIWPSRLAPDLVAWLSSTSDRSVHRWARSIGAAPLVHAAPTNINRVADLALVHD